MSKSKQKTKFSIFTVLLIIVFVILFVYALSFILLLSWGFMTSLKSIIDFTDLGNVMGLPDERFSAEQLKFANYTLVINSFEFPIPDKSYYSALFGLISKPKIPNTNFLMLVWNSVAYAIFGCVLHSFTAATVAFICAKYKFKYCEVIYTTALIIMIIPIVGAYPSELKMMQDLGLYNSYFGMWFQKINFTGIYFFVFYAFFRGLPDSYIEAAEIDGASQLSTYITIVIPLAIKVISTVMLLSFIDYWNNYQNSLLYFPSMPTLAYGVFQMSTQTTNHNPNMKGAWGTPQKVAGCMTLALPLIVLFIVFRNKILGDVSLGGLKE